MTNFLQYLVQGLAQGAIYSLVALGFVIIFRGTKVLNFAQGAFMLFGAFLTFNVARTWGINYWVAIIISTVAMAFAVTLCGASSMASSRVSACTAPLLAT